MTELGTTTLGRTYLGQTLTVIGTGAATSLDSSQFQSRSLTPTSESTLNTNTVTPTVDGTRSVQPVILDATATEKRLASALIALKES
jgi:hypothetical protein